MGLLWGDSTCNTQLTFLGTGAVNSGGSVRKLKRNAQPLFRGESPGFFNLLLCQHVAKLTGPSRQTQAGKWGSRFRFHDAILHGNAMPVTTQDDDLVATPPPWRRYIRRTTWFQATAPGGAEQDRAPR